MEPEKNWLLLGDFNFIRSLDNRNLPGGDINDIFLFNEIIGHLGLLELPLKGRRFTWSNMQDFPLLEQLDWFFTSASWIDQYPNTQVNPLAKTASDHVPCVVSITPESQKLIFSDLKIIGSINLVLWSVFSKSGKGSLRSLTYQQLLWIN